MPAIKVNLEAQTLPSVKTLVVWWSADDDQYSVKVQDQNDDIRLTKRTVLSKIASIFDPIGIVAPVVVTGKMLLQKIWLSGLDWDEPLNSDLQEEVQKWLMELAELKSVKLDRCLEFSNECKTEFHTFVDASGDAYGAVSYVHQEFDTGEVKVRFVAAKTRVTPLKTVSIPR